jgi:ubiquinone/menaquinone biosynthesis C-methylase UbiE
MSDQREIYNQQAADYDRLVTHEDYLHNLPRAIQQIAAPQDATVVDMGAGTGRIAAILAPHARQIYAFDVSRHMLHFAARKAQAQGLYNCTFAIADHRRLPVKDGFASLVISGWSIAYLAVWPGEDWQTAVKQALAEGKRALRPGGKFIIIETLGTGRETPLRPEKLAAYYALLEGAGFHFDWIRTDYHFASVEEAQAVLEFFFGEAAASEMIVEADATVPECTGIWWRER